MIKLNENEVTDLQDEEINQVIPSSSIVVNRYNFNNEMSPENLKILKKKRYSINEILDDGADSKANMKKYFPISNHKTRKGIIHLKPFKTSKKMYMDESNVNYGNYENYQDHKNFEVYGNHANYETIENNDNNEKLDVPNLNIEHFPFSNPFFGNHNYGNLQKITKNNFTMVNPCENIYYENSDFKDFKNLKNFTKFTKFTNCKDLKGCKDLKDLKDCKELPPDTLNFKLNPKSIFLRNNLISNIPLEITKFQNLEELHLDYNRITEISPILCKLRNLKILSLANNLIKEVPDEITSLINLTHLYINNNLINEIKISICKLNLNLQYCYFHNNKIHHIPKEISKLNNLKEMTHDWFIYLSFTKLLKINDKSNSLKKLLFLGETIKSSNISFIDFIKEMFDSSIEKLHLKKIFQKGRNLLHFSCIQGNFIESKALIENGFDINSEDDLGCSPLLISLFANNIQLANFILLRKGCNPNSFSENFGLPLHLTIEKKYYQTAELIIRHPNFNEYFLDTEGNNALHILFNDFPTDSPENLKLANLLVSKKFNKNLSNKLLLTPIHIAVKKNQKGAINFALTYNRNPLINVNDKFNLNSACGKFGWTTLHYAVIYSDIDVIIDLIKEGADIMHIDQMGRKAKDLSILNSSIYKILLKAEHSLYKKCLRRGHYNIKPPSIFPCLENSYNEYLRKDRLNLTHKTVIREYFTNQYSKLINVNDIDEDDGSTQIKINDYIKVNSKPYQINSTGSSSAIKSISIICPSDLGINNLKQLLRNNETVKAKSHPGSKDSKDSKDLALSIKMPLIFLDCKKTRNMYLQSDCSIYHNSSYNQMASFNDKVLYENDNDFTKKTNKKSDQLKYYEYNLEAGIYNSSKNYKFHRRPNYSSQQCQLEIRSKNQNKMNTKELSSDSEKNSSTCLEKLIEKQIVKSNLYYLTYKSYKSAKYFEVIKFIYCLIKSQTKDSRLMLEYLLKNLLKNKFNKLKFKIFKNKGFNYIPYAWSLGIIHMKLNLNENYQNYLENVNSSKYDISQKGNSVSKFFENELVNSIKISNSNSNSKIKPIFLKNKTMISDPYKSDQYNQKTNSNNQHNILTLNKKQSSSILSFKYKKILNTKNFILLNKHSKEKKGTHEIIQ